MKQYSIAIPCNQDYNLMSIVDGGRFCDVCNKTVFTLNENFDERQIQNGNICGMIPQKTERVIEFTRLKNSLVLVPVISTILLAGDIQAQTQAQYKLGKVHIEKRDSIILKGKVIDEKTKEGIMCKLEIVGKKSEIYETITSDEQGIFKITIPKDKQEKIDIHIIAFGYDNVRIKNVMKSESNVLIELKKEKL